MEGGGDRPDFSSDYLAVLKTMYPEFMLMYCTVTLPRKSHHKYG